MTPFDAVILGIVEGATEFLPVSSTGHLILASTLLGILQSDFVKTFEIVIQMGSIAAVIVLYFRSFLRPRVLALLAVGFVPTGVIGLTLYHFVKAYLIGNSTVVVISLIAGGFLLILFDRFRFDWDPQMKVEDITYGKAVLIGLAQSVALVPGVSRSGATIITGLALGVPRQTIVEFSFLLAVPTMIAASGYDLLKSAGAGTLAQGGLILLLIGFLTAFVVATGAIRFLLRYINENGSLTKFGIYRIAIALLFLAVFFTRTYPS